MVPNGISERVKVTSNYGETDAWMWHRELLSIIRVWVSGWVTLLYESMDDVMSIFCLFHSVTTNNGVKKERDGGYSFQ